VRKVAGCLIERNGKFLILHRSATDERRPGIWEMPAGRPDGDETPEENALRETKEESGLKAEIVKLLGVNKTIVDGEEKNFYCFLAKADGEVKLSFEHDDLAWKTKEEILAIEKLSQDLKYFINKLI
jgi:8-oxo-dGTP diphosphatase